MKAFIEGVLKMAEANEFTDAQTNEPVHYFTYYVQSEDGLLKLNSRQDFREYIDESAVIAVDIKADYNKPSLFRVKMIDVKTQK